MGKARRVCRDCRRKADVDVVISKRGYCRECAAARVGRSIMSITNHSGPEYERWKEAMDMIYKKT